MKAEDSGDARIEEKRGDTCLHQDCVTSQLRRMLRSRMQSHALQQLKNLSMTARLSPGVNRFQIPLLLIVFRVVTCLSTVDL